MATVEVVDDTLISFERWLHQPSKQALKGGGGLYRGKVSERGSDRLKLILVARLIEAADPDTGRQAKTLHRCHTDKQTVTAGRHRRTDRQTERWTDRHTDSKTYSQNYRPTDRPTDRQACLADGKKIQDS
jgi:hypothetical protein